MVDKNNRDKGVARYSTRNTYLTSFLKGNRSTVYLSVRRAYLDVWVCILMAIMGINNNGKWDCRILVTGGRGLLSGEHVEPQTGHNDFPYRKDMCPGIFIIVIVNDAVTLWLSKSS